MGPSRTPSEVSVWLKFPPAPKILTYLRSNSVVNLSTMLNAGSSVTSVARSLKISRQSVIVSDQRSRQRDAGSGFS